MQTYTAEVGNEVRAARARRRMTQQELADAVGISRERLMRRESGDVAWTVDQLAAVASILNISVLDLYPDSAS